MSIGERIKQRRLELNMTQDELAEKLGYNSKATISKIELGRRDITQSMIAKYAEALRTTPAYLMEWDEDQSNGQEEHYYINEDAREYAEFLHNNPEYKVLFDASRNVKKEDLEFVKQMIDRANGTND